MTRDVVHEAEKTSKIIDVRKTVKKSVRKSRKRLICLIRKNS
jgi:hypothetical protein